MTAKASLQCLLFSASPHEVVRMMEKSGGVRSGGPWGVWFYPNAESPLIRSSVLPARGKDSNALGISDTIGGYIAGDLTYASWQSWFTALARAASMSEDEAAALIEKGTNVVIDCSAYSIDAREPLRVLVLGLSHLGDGIVWTTGQSWRCRDFPARSGDLDAALWGDAA